MTPLYAINQALKIAGVIGIGETAAPEDYNDAFNDLQNMLFQWQQERWLVYSLIDVPLVSTGAEFDTIGIGGAYNVLRPDNIEAAYFIALNQQGEYPVSYPLEILNSREDYARITLKSLSTWPMYLFYDSAFPFGNVYVNPVPPAGQYEIHLLIKTPLPDPTNQTGEMSIPPEYNMAIIYNLAMLRCIAYGMPVPPDLRLVAGQALNVIRNANTQIARLQMPPGIAGRGGVYNPYSDRIN